MAIFCVIFASCILASPVQHISDLHSKFALRPHHVWKYSKTSNPPRLRIGEEKRKRRKKKKKEEETT